MKHKLLLLYSWFVRISLFWVPDMPFTMRFRGWLYGLGMKRCGKDLQVAYNAIVKDLENISVGNHVYFAPSTCIYGHLSIEDEVLIAMGSVVISGNHTSVCGSYRFGPSDQGITSIGRGAWVGANCTLLKGAHLPENSVLAANSCLTKAMAIPNAIYGGVPARLIKVHE
ncbi:MAG: acyltransferase [Bacteroidales bacterium]|nr:acyltransferase [Bacteroidales bacterium]